MMGGGVFASRTISDSFAVVKTGEYPDITIYAENHPVASTNSSGLAMVPRLRAYDRNSISIDAAELPLDAEIETQRQVAIPYLRSGVLVNFPVKPSRGATIRITLEDGNPIPSGAIVQVIGMDEEFPVALRGETFLSGLDENNTLVVS
jgi:outer membrane usher protein